MNRKEAYFNRETYFNKVKLIFTAVLNSVLNPVSKPALNSVLKPGSKPFLKTILNSVSKPASKLILKPAPKPVINPALIPVLIPVLAAVLAAGLIAVPAASMPALAEEKTEFPEVEELAAEIYRNYQEYNFDNVYDFFHPAIKEELSREKYIAFQEENQEKYQLELSEIKITEVEKIESLPRKFDSYLQEEDYQEAYEASINYLLNIRIFVSGHEREVDTETYIVKFNDDYYLVWDPSVVQEDDPGAGIE